MLFIKAPQAPVVRAHPAKQPISFHRHLISDRGDTKPLSLFLTPPSGRDDNFN